MSTFSTSSRQKKAQNPQFFTLLTSKCASRHNGVHFFDTFSTSERQKVVRDRQFLTLLTWKCASRHNGVHFFDTFSTSQLPKVVREWCVLYIFTWKCASRHNGVHFFDISTSKSGPTLVCFVHFDLEMCFAPQRRALFRHLNFQKWSENGVFCTFSLGNVLRATTACTFSTSQLPKVVRTWCVLYILTWKCASRHNGVHFFISHLASWLRTRRFSEPTFRPSGATNHWKNTVNRDFPTFSRICIFFLLIFSLLTLLTSAFQLSILSEVSLLNFLRLATPTDCDCDWYCFSNHDTSRPFDGMSVPLNQYFFLRAGQGSKACPLPAELKKANQYILSDEIKQVCFGSLSIYLCLCV